MTEASVIIATRDRASFLCDCLAALAGQSAAGRFDVVVVDNGSSDDTALIAAQFESANVRRLYVEEPNRAKARNSGIRTAQAPILIFCDDDTVAPAHFVEAHLAAHERRPRSVVSGPIINVSASPPWPAPGAHNYSRAFFCTCNVSVARAAVAAAGGFDERYDLYGWEDTDLGIRLRALGLRRTWSWDAYIYHVKPKASLAFERRLALAREKGEMAARFVRKAPTVAVRLATGAYGANFARARLLGMQPMRRLYQSIAADERLASGPLGRWAQMSLIDAAYVDAMRAALADSHAEKR